MKIMQKPKNLITTLALICVVLFNHSCSQEELDVPNQDLAIEIPIKWKTDLNFGSRTNGTDITTGSFSAVAAVEYCWGESIRFFGTVENKVNRFTDNNGTEHYTRHWSIKGLDALGLGNVQSGLAPGTEYTVVAGAEMFVVTDPVFNAGGVPVGSTSGKIYIHQGTVVLKNIATGEQLVARHVIKKNPKTGELSSNWYCMGN
ncbi:hypothetical protein SAMN03097699_0964 [Flavobacteriaceae bacterium MAR_2010_188]|nr:hypothetical protein SAMN03097699_0964 [Flavobacteriaceae bacterium MAR_2010_188]